LDAAVLRGIAESLVTTLATRQEAHDLKEDELEARISELETEVHFWQTDKDVPPDGYVINGGRVTVGIPIGEGLSVQAKFVKQLPDGRVACLSDRDDMDDLPYFLELYAQPFPSRDGEHHPIPIWFERALRANSEIFTNVKRLIGQQDDWGLAREIERYRTLDQHLFDTRRQIDNLESMVSSYSAQLHHSRLRLDAANVIDRIPNLEMLVRNTEGLNRRQVARRTAPLPRRARSMRADDM
jgi:hypothetical protein